jgi:uncharacterized protein (TIGR00255 family)
VQATLRIEREPSSSDYRLHEAVLRGYLEQLESLSRSLGRQEQVPLAALLALPGVADEASLRTQDVEAQWPMIENVLREALERLDEMRRREGAAMAADLLANCRILSEEVEEVARLAPRVVESYRARVTERLSRLMAEHNLELDHGSIIREIGLFAERCDISEEIVRLRSHLEQFRATVENAGGGKKLEFLSQELFREANTIGSKANDSQVAQRVVEMKTAIERIREMVQNIE